MNGIKSLPNGDFCANCNAMINTNLYNFCPKCGNPLSQNAIKIAEQREIKVKIQLLDELANEIQDEKSLQAIIQKLKSF